MKGGEREREKERERENLMVLSCYGDNSHLSNSYVSTLLSLGSEVTSTRTVGCKNPWGLHVIRPTLYQDTRERERERERERTDGIQTDRRMIN